MKKFKPIYILSLVVCSLLTTQIAKAEIKYGTTSSTSYTHPGCGGALDSYSIAPDHWSSGSGPCSCGSSKGGYLYCAKCGTQVGGYGGCGCGSVGSGDVVAHKCYSCAKCGATGLQKSDFLKYTITFNKNF